MRIIRDELVYDGTYLQTRSTTYEDKTGAQHKWEWTQRQNNQKAVVIVAVVDKGYKPFRVGSGYDRDLSLVVIKEFRVPLYDYEWGFPAGLIEGGEDSVEAAKRELQEETGLKVKAVIRKSPYIYNSAGMTDESISMVFVECEGELSRDNLEDAEDIETFLMDRNEVEELLQDDTKKIGAKAWIIMNAFVRHNTI